MPIVIRDGLADWPAASKWSPEAFSSLSAQRKVTLSVSQSGVFRYKSDGSPLDPDNQLIFHDVPFPAAARHIIEEADGLKYYVSQQSLAEKLPELLADLRFPETGPATTNLWFGSAGTVSPLHFDKANNLFAQVFGTKTFVIFPPNDAEYLYPFPEGTAMSHVSQVDLDNQDPVKFPLVREATGCEFQVREGELLFLPAFWWHQVRSDTVSISANKWWQPRLEQCSVPAGLQLLRAEYLADTWTGLRRVLNISNEALTDVVKNSTNTSLPLAILALSVIVKGRGAAGNADGIPPELNSQLGRLVDAVLSGTAIHREDARPVVTGILDSISQAQGAECS